MSGGPGMSKMLLMLPAMLAMRSLDFEDPTTLFYTRIAFAAVVSLAMSVIGYLYSRIRSNQDRRVIRVPPPAVPSWARTAEVQEIQEMSVGEYDYGELKRLLQQTVISVVIVTFLHWKWAICPPLFIQCLMMPYTIYNNPLFKIYMLGQSADKPGDELQRPFKDNSNPFAAFMGQSATETAAAEKKERKEKKKKMRKEGDEGAAQSSSSNDGPRKRNPKEGKADD